MIKGLNQSFSLMNFHSDPFQSPYTLSAGFPPRDIVDAHLSLVDAGLLGAAVTQKYL